MRFDKLPPFHENYLKWEQNLEKPIVLEVDYPILTADPLGGLHPAAPLRP
jgi:hypothetical protein